MENFANNFANAHTDTRNTQHIHSTNMNSSWVNIVGTVFGLTIIFSQVFAIPWQIHEYTGQSEYIATTHFLLKKRTPSTTERSEKIQLNSITKTWRKQRKLNIRKVVAAQTRSHISLWQKSRVKNSTLGLHPTASSIKSCMECARAYLATDKKIGRF